MPPPSLLITVDQQSDEELAGLAAFKDDQALAELVRRLTPVVHSKTKTYFLAGGDRQDVIQEGLIGLYKAVCDYDQTKHPSFRHFADLCVTRQVISAVKRATRHKHAPLNAYTSLSAPTSDETDTESWSQLVDAASDPAGQVESVAAVLHLRSLCDDVLTDLEKEVLVSYVQGDSYAVIATRLGRSNKAVDNAVQRIRCKLEGRLRGGSDVSVAPPEVWLQAA
ncbi:RNA polymerase sporulation sigma factor SigH [soil metagenome]